MNEAFLFGYSSLVVDDLSIGAVYEALGLPKTWAGTHPHFKTQAAIFATGKGGMMLLENRPDATAEIIRYTGLKERNFHINLLVDDLTERRKVASASPYAADVSDVYDGPLGKSFITKLSLDDGKAFWVEFSEGHENLVTSDDSMFVCVDSIAMVAPKREDLIKPLTSLGLWTEPRANDGYFEVLGALNEIMMLQDWHYLEVNEPTADGGVMYSILGRIGQPGILGANLVPKNMSVVIDRAKAAGISLNTEQPIRLDMAIGDRKYACADIITVNPKSTGGARMFILDPLEYPWQLVS